MDRILQHLSDYASELTYCDLPQEVIDRTKHIVVDTIGCALGAAQSPPAVIARAAASEVTSAAPATVLVSGQKTSPDLAAFVNGVMIRYLDYNDTYTSFGTCHPSDLLAPVLAVVVVEPGAPAYAEQRLSCHRFILCGEEFSRPSDRAAATIISATLRHSIQMLKGICFLRRVCDMELRCQPEIVWNYTTIASIIRKSWTAFFSI